MAFESVMVAFESVMVHGFWNLMLSAIVAFQLNVVASF